MVEELRVPADEAADVASAVSALWPGGPAVVADAAPPADGLRVGDGALEWWRAGALVRRVEVPDAATAVLLARSWLAADEGLAGAAPPAAEPPGDVAPVVPPPPPSPPERHTRTWVGIGALGPLGDAPAGARLAAGWAGDPVEIDVALWIAAPPSTPEDRVDRTAALVLDAVTDLGLPRRVQGRVTVAPVAWAGADLGPTVLRRAKRDGRPYLSGTVHAGAGVDLWAGTAGGARVGVQVAPDVLDLDVHVVVQAHVAGARSR